MLLVTAMTFLLWLHRSLGGISGSTMPPFCHQRHRGGVYGAVQMGNLTAFTASVQGGKHADVEGFILPVSRPAFCGARQPLLSFPLSSVGKLASGIWFPLAQAERKKLYSVSWVLEDVLS